MCLELGSNLWSKMNLVQLNWDLIVLGPMGQALLGRQPSTNYRKQSLSLDDNEYVWQQSRFALATTLWNLAVHCKLALFPDTTLVIAVLMGVSLQILFPLLTMLLCLAIILYLSAFVTCNFSLLPILYWTIKLYRALTGVDQRAATAGATVWVSSGWAASPMPQWWWQQQHDDDKNNNNSSSNSNNNNNKAENHGYKINKLYQ